MASRLRAFAVIAAGASVTAAAILTACTSSDPGGANDAASEEPEAAACPNDLPAACPQPPPSYKNDVRSIIDRRCNGCHANGGVAARRNDFSTYDNVANQRSAILNQVYACYMPPPDAGQPTPDERQKLLGWLVCKAPNN
jgi:uncharacterized membrane protein